MDNEEYQARLDDLGEMLEGTYTLVGKLLSLLPIPISLPSIAGDRALLDDQGIAVAVAVERARIALLDLPLNILTTAMLNTLLVEWLSARDMYVWADFGPPLEYRILAIRIALERMGVMLEKAEHRMGPEY